MKIRAALIAVILLSVSCSMTVGTQAHGVQVHYIQPTKTVMVEYSIVGTVNVRSCPSTSCGVVGILYKGQVVEASCGSGNWCSVPGGWVYLPCVIKEERTCR